MNSQAYWSISEWSTNSRKNPQAAAEHFFSHLDQQPKDQRAAAIAKTLSKEQLISAFETSVQGDGPLSGVPYLLKDLYDVASWETNASSLFLNELRGTPTQSSALARSLDQAGGVFAGKTHLVEFAYGMEGSNCHFGDGVHPHFPTRISGGSSSGSVWAVANGLVPLASGSDTGGSVRVPAAYNGLYGIRVTPDHAWSKDGSFPLSPSFDTSGWFTRSAEDLLITLEALFPNFPKEADEPKGLELFPNYSFIDQNLSTPHEEAISELPLESNSEATDRLLSLPDLVRAYLVTSSHEAYEVHKEWHEEKNEHYDPQTWERVAKGNTWQPSELEEAAEIKNQVHTFFDDVFADYDFAVLPVAPCPAPLLGEATELREAHLRLTAPGSLGQLPILTVPYFLESGLSGGLQIIVPDLSEKSLSIWRYVLNG